MAAPPLLRSKLPRIVALAALGLVLLAAGVYLGVGRRWPVPQLQHLVALARGPAADRDAYGRLRQYPGKAEIPCPAQTGATAVLLVAGQSNAANYQGQRHQSPDDRVVNFFDGHCYRAASPLLGADGRLGETWTLLGLKLLRSGRYATVVIVPAAVGGSPIRRWVPGGDLNRMLVDAVRGLHARYAVTAVIWDQGAEDYALRTPQERYREGLQSLIDTLRAEGVRAPFYITRCSLGGEDWSPDNPVARAQASLVNEAAGVLDGPNTDRELTAFDRYDGYHFSASGQEKYTDDLVALLLARPAAP